MTTRELSPQPTEQLPVHLADATADESSLRRFLFGLPGVDPVGIEQRAAGLATRSIKRDSKLAAIDLAISMVDLTTLGVVGILAPSGSPLLGLISVIAPVITGGNACVLIAAEEDPCVAITFAEVTAISDVPAGVINILTGRTSELAPHLAAHADVNALDLTGSDSELRASLEQAAAQTVKRVSQG